MNGDGKRIPSVVWMLLAFSPWILFWALTALGSVTDAVLAGLGVSITINTYHLATRKPKILDVLSLLFLGALAFATLILGSDIFTLYGIILSDAALAAMTWSTLLLGYPFTFDYAKDDWDEAFWANPLFLRTNQIISAVWGVVFTAQASLEGVAMSLGLGGSARIVMMGILPRSLLFVAIGFTVWFSKWYPKHSLDTMI